MELPDRTDNAVLLVDQMLVVPVVGVNLAQQDTVKSSWHMDGDSRLYDCG